MSDLLLGGLLPRRWHWDKLAPYYVDLIILNWLELEVDPNAEISIPILRTIQGYRNREVYNWVQATREVRDYEITMKLYGSTAIENVKWAPTS